MNCANPMFGFLFSLMAGAGGAGRQKIPVVLALLSLCACSSTAVRPERSTLGCARAVIEQHVPASRNDKQTHCLAAGLIARYCSPAEATLAAMAKEFRDLFDAGDAEWADWRADRAGIRCAAHAGSDDDVSACCRGAPEAADGLRN